MSYLPLIITAVVGAASAFAAPAQEWIAAHPAIAAVMGALATIIGILLKSPVQKKDE